MPNLPEIISLSTINFADFLFTNSLFSKRLELKQLGLPVPPTLLITSTAFDQFIETNNLSSRLAALLQTCDLTDPAAVNITAQNCQKIICNSPLPKVFFQNLSRTLKSDLTSNWLTFSTKVIEQPPTHLKPLFIKGDSVVSESLKSIWANWFTPKHLVSPLPSHNLILTPPDLTLTAYPDSAFIGSIDTSHPFLEHKHLLNLTVAAGCSFGPYTDAILPTRYLINRETGSVLSVLPTRQIFHYQIDRDGFIKRLPFKNPNLITLPPAVLAEIINAVKTIHHHYGFPQHLTFMVSQKNQLSLWTVGQLEIDDLNQSDRTKPSNLTQNLNLIGQGLPIAPGIVSGPLVFINSHKPLSHLPAGCIVYTDRLTPLLFPVLRQAQGLITEKGSPLSHAGILAREIGLPTVSGITLKNTHLREHDCVTLNGHLGSVFLGGLVTPLPVTSTLPLKLNPAVPLKTATKIYLDTINFTESSCASADGFIIRGNTCLTFSPFTPKKALADPDKYLAFLTDFLTHTFNSAGERPIYYLITDDPKFYDSESNAYLGLRGAVYYSQNTAFLELEIKAILAAQKALSLTPVTLTLPYVRFPEELRDIKRVLASFGWARNGSHRLCLSLDTPSALLNLEQFLNSGLDSFLVNSDHLIPLTLGLDPNLPEFSAYWGLEHQSIKTLLTYAQTVAHDHRLPLIAYGYSFGHAFLYLENLVRDGVTGIVSTPALYSSLRERLYLTEKRLLT